VLAGVAWEVPELFLDREWSGRFLYGWYSHTAVVPNFAYRSSIAGTPVLLVVALEVRPTGGITVTTVATVPPGTLWPYGLSLSADRPP
jgi:hypothetical protein